MKHKWLIITFLLLFLLACNATTSDHPTMKKIDTWPINDWLQPYPEKDAVFFLWQDGETRRLTLRYGYGGQEIDLGHLSRAFGEDAPMEAQFVAVEGTQFIVFWVDQQNLPYPAKFILLYRPRVTTPHIETRESKMVEVTPNGLSVLPIFPLEQKEWDALEYIGLLPRNAEDPPLFRQEFEPPFSLDGRFQSVTLPSR